MPINQMLISVIQESGQEELYQGLINALTDHNVLPAIMAGGAVDMTILSLVLSRYWQSALFNPGGFRAEFHELRLQPWMVIALIITAGLISTLWTWFALEPVLMPLVIAGSALIHGIVAKKNLGGVWITVFYIALLLVTPYVLPLLLVLATADAWIDFRSRITTSNP